MKKGVLIKYHKLLLLLLTFVIAYALFYGRNFPAFNNFVISLSYVGVFISGMLFSYGFTAAPATALLLILAKQHNIFIATIIGGLGALITDLLIFQFIRTTFSDEIKQLAKEKIFMRINKKIPKTFKLYFLPFLASFIIASPLPDEIGVSLMASTTKISFKAFAIISILLNTIGIFIILNIGKII